MPIKPLSIFAALGLTFSSSFGATLVSSAFDLNPGSSVNTSGTLDWGYFVDQIGDTVMDSDPSNVAFASLVNGAETPMTVRDATPGIGAVTFTEDGTTNGTSNTRFTFSFDGNTAGNLSGNLSSSEDMFTINFNDLGAGTTAITFYLAHTNLGRTFDVDYSITASDGNLSATTTSGAVVNNRFSYTLEFTTTDALADVSLSFASTGGGSGAFELGGYTVTAVPEASAFALIGLSGLFLLRRRRI